jgi:hypothetical protein
VINNVAPELAEVYKTETGKDIDLEVDESTPSKGAAPKASMSDEDKQAMDWANANPSDARAKAIKEKLKKKGLIK